MLKGNYSEKQVIAANQNIKEKEYWLNQLGGIDGKAFIYYDNTAPLNDTQVGERRSSSIPIAGELFERLMKLCNNSDARLHMILSALMTVLLYKYSGKSDIIIGTPIYKQEVDTQFINTVLALRSRISPGTTFKDLLMGIRSTIKEAVAHQNYPIGILCEQLEMGSAPGEFPLFDVAILLENVQERVYLDPVSCNLIVSFKRTASAIEVSWDYSPHRYQEDTIGRTAAHLGRLVDVLSQNVDRPVSEAQLLTSLERRELVVDLNCCTVDIPENETIIDRFEAQVAADPQKTAVVFREKPVTYADLNRKANLLARHLRDQGVGPDTVIAVMVEPSDYMMVALLGIIKAGGAYLPVDPEYPPERIAFIIKDSATRHLVLQTDLIKAVPDAFNGDIVKIEAFGDQEDRDDAGDNPRYDVLPHHLVYVIYTSGSTGRPKGVLIEHRNLVANLSAFFNEFDITSEDTVMQLTSFAFDAFVEEVFPVLLNGGTVAIPHMDQRMDLDAMAAFADTHRVTFVDTTPLLLKEFNETETLTAIKTVISGGDVLKPEYVDRLMEGGTVYNTYGPTETTICAAYYKCSGEEVSHIPIGKPIANYALYIVDESGDLIPPGLPGELWIAGPGVARGYLNRPELNTEKFVPNPFIKEIETGNISHATGPVCYRSGDLVRRLPDGNIQFLGRIDEQIKIRGFRIELGEIENKLREHPAVSDAVVMVLGQSGEEKYLCGYITATDPVTAAQLRDFLAESLPEYMIPWFFIPMDKFPLTTSGKIDKKALPEPRAQEAKPYAPPRDVTEKSLVDIWAQVLTVEKERVGIDTNFFDLGGNSLKAISVASRIHKAFDIKMQLTDIFELQTIRGIAGFIHQGTGDHAFAAIEPAPKKDFYPLSSAQKRLYVLQRMEPQGTVYNMPNMLVQSGDLDRERLEKAFRALCLRHESLRTSFEIVGGEPVQRVHDDISFEIEFHDFSTGVPSGSLQDDQDKLIKDVIDGFVRPFDLSHPPLARIGLVKLPDSRFIFMADLHHIISDGVSQDLMIRDFMALYQGASLPELRLQYKDYTEWLNAVSDDRQENLDKQRIFWIDQFSDGIPVLALPSDFPRPEVREYSGRNHRFTIPRQTAQQLRTSATNCGATVNMILMAALHVLLARYADQEDIVTGTVVAGRGHADLENIIGMFVNTLPIRCFPKKELALADFLSQVKERSMSAYENQDYPFEQLVEQLPIKRDTGREALFDVMYVYDNLPAQANESPTGDTGSGNMADGQSSSQFQMAGDISKFDLTLYAYEIGEDMAFTCEYRTRLFKPETIERMFSDYTLVLETIAQNPTMSIRDVPLKPHLPQTTTDGNGMDATSTVDAFSQNIILSGGSLDAQMDYWLDKLDGDLPLEGLFSHYGTSLSGKEKIETRQFDFPDDVHRTLSGGESSPRELLGKILTGLFFLSTKTVRSSDVVIGTPPFISMEDEGPSGLRLNHLLPLRANVDARMTRDHFQDQVDRILSEARTNMDYPFSRLVKRLDIPLTDVPFPFLSTMVVFKGLHEENLLENGESDTEKTMPPGCSALFVFQANRDGLKYHIRFDASVVDPENVDALNRHLLNYFSGRLIDGSSSLGSSRLETIDILNAGERKQLLEAFNGETLVYDRDKTITRLFTEIVEQFPHNIVVCEPGTLDHPPFPSVTYEQLNREADALARELANRGVGPGTVAAVSLPQSILLIRSIMAVLKTGAAFLPIDADLPVDRRQYMLKDSHAHILLAEDPDAATQFKHTPCFSPDQLPASDTAAAPFNSDNQSGSDPAYIIYTSGSTGKPKGVMVEHRALHNLCAWHNHAFAVSPQDRASKYANIAFDATVWEIFPYILAGAGLYIVPEDIKMDLPALNRFFETHGITLAFLPTQVCEHFMKQENHSLRFLLTGGDKLKGYEPKNYRLVNNYGPTENAVVATSCIIDQATANIPIGKAIAGNRIFILDHNRSLQPVGIPGELCICGESLARGYLNRPELTAEAFVDFVPGPGSPVCRMYRTGDLTRRLPDGNIEFLGRIDTQVKIRGFRIELGEIENRLTAYPKISETAVLEKTEPGGEKYLCAYIVPAEMGPQPENKIDAARLAGEIRDYLAQDLPRYMIPASYILLPRMPFNTAGKIDRKALRRMNLRETRPGGRAAFAAPKTDMEKQVADVWKEILGIDDVGINDNFFDLGGNSFDIVKINARLGEILEKEFPVVKMFKYPTVATLANFLVHGEPDQAVSQEKILQKTEKLSKGKERMRARGKRKRK